MPHDKNVLTGKVKYPVMGQNAQSMEICPSIKTDLDGLGKPAVKVFWYMGEIWMKTLISVIFLNKIAVLSTFKVLS